MASAARHSAGGEPLASAFAELSSRELARVAGKHLTDLLDHERRAVVEQEGPSFPRMRRFGRAILLGSLSIVETFVGAWRWLWSPRRTLGRLVRRVRLFAPSKTFGWWTALLVIVAVVTGCLQFKLLESIFGIFGSAPHREPLKTVVGAVFGAVLIALLVLLWNDLMRLPFLAWRIRRRIILRPERVLLPNLLARQARPLIERLALDIVPRAELYDDLLPGVYARDRKDVQIVVGDAGAGKTTALLAVSQLLAQNGLLPVLVPLRDHLQTKIIEPARERFKRQVEARVRSDAEAELLWRWLMLRRRVAILVDDIDQVGPDGERGLVMRKMLDEAAESGLSVIATARPAGVPAGIAASAIDLGAIDERDAIAHVVRRAEREPSFSRGSRPSLRRIEEWVSAGRLAEVPFYLELLVGLAAVGQCPRLPQATSTFGTAQDAGRIHRGADGRWAWNPLWVRFRLLEHYYEQIGLGRVRRSLGIEPRERRATLTALEDAALGMLVSRSLAARMKLRPQDVSESDGGSSRPPRQKIFEFIDSDDRSGLHPGVGGDDRAKPADDSRSRGERCRVSPHEVIDAGERLAILDLRAEDGETAFHHRIMQAYLAARCLVWREYVVGEQRRANPIGRAPDVERDWIAALLDHRQPDRMTAHLTLTFAAMRAREIAEAERPDEARWKKIAARIVAELITRAEAAREGRSPEEQEEERRLAVTLTTATADVETQLTLALAPGSKPDSIEAARSTAKRIDPLYKPDFEHRSDPDDALLKLATAADIARAVPHVGEREYWNGTQSGIKRLDEWKGEPPDIAEEVRNTPGATIWTKLRAIEALAVPSDSRGEGGADSNGADPTAASHDKKSAALCSEQRWNRIWEFARDPDYDVKRAACDALEENAFEAFEALADEIEELIYRAAARSAAGRWLMRPDETSDPKPDAATQMIAPLLSLIGGADDDGKRHPIAIWKTDDVEGLKALGAILPAIVSGFREDPSIELESGQAIAHRGGGGDRAAADHGAARVKEQEQTWRDEADEVTCHKPRVRERRLPYSRRATHALESLVALAFEGNHGPLEAEVAQGFRSDALRHAQHPENNVSGPGWVTLNRELVAGICVEHARFWYARIALYQALALYAVAGADAQQTLDLFARHMRRGGRDRHPFTRRAARLARAAVRRSELRSGRWLSYLWGDEGKDTRRRATQLSPGAAQLLADVTVLLNLNQTSPEDRQDAFAHMQTLPYCLSGSRDRSEILGEGCPSRCGWGLCPYRQPPPDEPDAHRGVRRAFCRQQREIALRRRPPWQHAIHRSKLREFWREMETRART